METSKLTERIRSRSLDVQPSSEELETTSEPFTSSDGGSGSTRGGTTKPTALCVKTPQPWSESSDPSSDSLLEAAYAGSHQMGHGSLGFKPLYISYITRDPCTKANLSCISASNSDLSNESVPDSICGPGPCHGSSSTSGADPGPVPRPELRSIPPQKSGNLQPDLPNYNYPSQWEPQKQPWEPLQVPETGSRGVWKPTEVEEKSKLPYDVLPRGQCLLNNWEEERATNHLDQIPSMQDGSESFFFRHGHQGLLTTQLQSPVSSSTTQKDSYQPPSNICRPLRGKREAMTEMLLCHHICKEVQAEQEPTKLFEVESVTHHDYHRKLVQAGPPAPIKPHDYRKEQPETFWLQRASQLPGVSNIRTRDTPFRKNCSFSTPVPLSLGQPLPYEHENFTSQMGEMSSLAYQGGHGCQAGRTTLI